MNNDIERLSEEMEKLRESLNKLMQSFEIVSQLAQSYIKLVSLYAEYGELSIDVVIPEIRHDSIAREIVRILFDLKRANISQITRELKGRRGKGSRNTVREKINHLIELGVVMEIKGERGKYYTLSKAVVSRWFELIGIPIKFEQI